MKYYAIITDGGPAFIEAKDLNAAYKIGDEGSLIPYDIFEIKSYLVPRKGIEWRALCAHTGEVLNTATELNILKAKIARMGGLSPV